MAEARDEKPIEGNLLEIPVVAMNVSWADEGSPRVEHETSNGSVQDSLDSLRVGTSGAMRGRSNEINNIMNNSEVSTHCSELLYLEECCRDHFTLNTPSSLVRFRPTAATRVFENGTQQFILEETLTIDPSNSDDPNKRRLYVKLLSDGSRGLQFLRLLYTIMCVFWTGIFFAFCLQVLLVMVLEMAVATGKTEIQTGLHIIELIGVIIGILVFTYGFAMCMVIAMAFINDVWTGHTLIKLFFFQNRYGNVLVDWICFLFFVELPMLVMCITLLARLQRWWQITMLFWYSCVSISFTVFCVNVVFFEVQGAINFLSKRHDLQGKPLLDVLKECILVRQRATYSGYRTKKYLARSSFFHAAHEHAISQIEEWSRQEYSGLWTRITLLSRLSQDGNANSNANEGQLLPGRFHMPVFTTLNPPQVVYTIDDVQEHLPYVTKHTWSLERLFFRPRNSRYVTIVGGPGALTDKQMKSSLACSIIGIITLYLLFIGALVWMHFPVSMIVAVLIFGILMGVPIYKDTRRMIRMMHSIIETRANTEKDRLAITSTTTEENAEGDGGPRPGIRPQPSRRESEIFLANESNEGVILVTQQERITLASDRLCWLSLATEIFFYFILPAVVLFRLQNFQLSFLFVTVAGISGLRRYINLLVVVEETGELDRVTGATGKIRWHKQSRLNVLIKAISYSKSRVFWQVIFLGVGAIWVVLFVSAAPSSTASIRTDQFTFVDGFSWTPVSVDVRYETCEFTKSSTFGENATLADYALLALLPYKEDATALSELGGWFQGVNVKEDLQTVNAFRKRNGVERVAVFFRLFRFGLDNGLDRGVISIRGTATAWDLLADNQLWSAAMLIQGLRVLLPLGEMWTPILDELIEMMSFFQSSSIEQVAFYKVTTKFALEIKNDASFDNVQLTGHSLGGGLAMISSAQTKIPSVALSGPNSMLSGKSVDPPVSPDDLDRYTFNIVPDRDMVARFDDLGKNYQRIRCTTDPHMFFGCHSAARSFCEIVTTCGNNKRPAVCDCVFQFGYDPPVADSIDTAVSFEDACATKGYIFPDDLS